MIVFTFIVIFISAWATWLMWTLFKRQRTDSYSTKKSMAVTLSLFALNLGACVLNILVFLHWLLV